ncbi:MAG: hypothetical protein U5L11_07250 [Arhodomonas sp.]|nr:hypothetical protein [Arhodomonas sp.]
MSDQTPTMLTRGLCYVTNWRQRGWRVSPPRDSGLEAIVAGSYYGIRPGRLPNGRLLWPADTVERLLGEAGDDGEAA